MQWREVLGYFVKERSLYKTAHHKRGMWFKWQDMYHTPMNYANVLVHWWRVIIRLSSGNLGSLGPIAPSPFRKDSTTPLDALSFRLIHSSLMFFSVVFANTGNIYQGMVEIIWWRNIVTTVDLSPGRVRSRVLRRGKRVWRFERLEFESTWKLKNLLIPNCRQRSITEMFGSHMLSLALIFLRN